MAFLSLLDDRARPKGSRDPLGFELTWSYFGRKVIGNLTTITSSLDNFIVALLGFYWANQLHEDLAEYERHRLVRETFLRYEQLAAYVRFYGKATDIMGITRVRKRIIDEDSSISLGLGSHQQILSDQTSYGLWGLYSTAARDTGLVTGNDRNMTEYGEALAQRIEAYLKESASTLQSLLQTSRPLERKQLEKLASIFMQAIHEPDIQHEMLEQLMAGKDPEGVQRELWGITQGLFKSGKSRLQGVGEFVDAILSTKPSAILKRRLKDIKEVERVLVAANNIFHYSRRKDGDKVAEVIDALDDKYHYAHLPDQLPDEDFPRKEALQDILNSLQQKKHRKALDNVLELNEQVMAQRNGAPWVEIERNDLFRVKIKSEKAELKSQEVLEAGWDYDYFLGSYLAIANQQLRSA